MDRGETTVRRWRVIPPPALRRPFALAYTLVFVATFIAAGVALDIALSSCDLGPCDVTSQWVLVHPLWWPAFLWGRDPPPGAMALAPMWWLLPTWMVSRVAIAVWLRYG